MSAVPEFLRDFSVSVNAKPYHGKCSSIVLPKFEMLTEEMRVGGMDTPYEAELGQNLLTTELTLHTYDATLYALLGLTPGNKVLITARGSIDDDGEHVPVRFDCFGKMKTLDLGSWEKGSKAEVKTMFTIEKCTLLINNVPIIIIDTRNNVRTINGVDQLKQIRENLGQ